MLKINTVNDVIVGHLDIAHDKIILSIRQNEHEASKILVFIAVAYYLIKLPLPHTHSLLLV